MHLFPVMAFFPICGLEMVCLANRGGSSSGWRGGRVRVSGLAQADFGLCHPLLPIGWGFATAVVPVRLVGLITKSFELVRGYECGLFQSPP